MAKQMTNFTDDLIKIRAFKNHGNPLVLVRSNKAAHIMGMDEWKHVYGRLHEKEKYNQTDWKARGERMDRVHNEKKAERERMEFDRRIAG